MESSLALWRLRRLQCTLKAASSNDDSISRPSALLFIAGVDGRDNFASCAVLRWLAWESQVGVAASRMRERRSVIPLGGDASLCSAQEQLLSVQDVDCLEETVLLLTRTSVSIFYHPGASSALGNLLNAGIPRLSEYVQSCVDDVDQAEIVKCDAFAQMLTTELKDGDVVGIGLPRGQDDANEEVEYWPLVQSLAAQTDNKKTSPFFFSQKFRTVDATTLICDAIEYLDPPAIGVAIDRATTRLRRHVNELDVVVAAHRASPLEIEAECLDMLTTLWNYGTDDNDSRAKVFAFVGTRSDAIGLNDDLAATPTTTSLTEPQQLAFEAREPESGIAVCRTYTLQAATESLRQMYLSLVRAFQDYCPRILRQHSLLLFRGETTTFVDEVRRAMTKLSGARCFVEVISGDLVYIRACLSGLAEDDGTSIGALAVGDTFVVTGQVQDASGWLTQGEAGLVTGDRCAPYIHCWPRILNTADKAALRDPHISRELLGSKTLGPFAADLLADLDVLPLTSSSCKVEIYEYGLSLFAGNAIVSFARCDDAMDVYIVGRMGDSFALGIHLGANAASKIGCLLGSTATSIAVVVRHGSESHRSMLSVLPAWRDKIRQSSQQSSSVSSEQRDARRNLFARVFEAVTLTDRRPAPLISLLESYAASHQSRLLDELWGPKLSRRSSMQPTPRSLYGLIGVPGSGVDEVAAAIARRGVEDSFENGRHSWSVVRAVVSADGCIDVDTTAKQLEASKQLTFLVLVVACCRDHVGTLLSAMQRSQAGRVRGCAAVVSNFVPRGRIMRPNWGDQCLPGLATVAVIVDDYETPDAWVFFERRLRKTGRPIRLANVSRGSKLGYAGPVVQALFELELTACPQILADRAFADYPSAAVMPPLAKLGSCATVTINFVFDRALFVKLLASVLLPKAKHITRAAALAPVNRSSNSAGGVLKKLLNLATTKVRAEMATSKRLSAWDRQIEAWRNANPAVGGSATALSGLIRFAVNGAAYVSPVGIDGNEKACSMWPDATRSDEPTYITVLGFSGLTPDALLHLCQLCAKDPIVPVPPLARQHLDEHDLQRILADKPLPPGWAFDGSLYVDTSGCRSKCRPDENQLIEDFLQEENDKIVLHNRGLAAA